MKKRDLSEGFTAQSLAERVGGTVIGDGSRRVMAMSALTSPIPGSLAFVHGRTTDKVQRHAESGHFSVLLVDSALEITAPIGDTTVISVKEPQRALLALIPLFYESENPVPGISPKAEIHPTARIGSGVTISAFVWIGENVVIGDNVVIYPQATIYPRCTIGRGTIIHAGAVVREDCVIGAESVLQAGAVIGTEGFGYIPDPVLGLRGVPHIGATHLGERVEVGANSCIDRGAVGTTTLDTGVKVDNLVQVGHNVQIGKYSLLCALVGIGGSAVLGSQVTLGGQCGVADHVTIADRTRVGSKGGVIGDIKTPGDDYAGFPHNPVKEWRRQLASLRRLPDLMKRLAKNISEKDHS